MSKNQQLEKHRQFSFIFQTRFTASNLSVNKKKKKMFSQMAVYSIFFFKAWRSNSSKHIIMGAFTGAIAIIAWGGDNAVVLQCSNDDHAFHKREKGKKTTYHTTLASETLPQRSLKKAATVTAWTPSPCRKWRLEIPYSSSMWWKIAPRAAH